MLSSGAAGRVITVDNSAATTFRGVVNFNNTLTCTGAVTCNSSFTCPALNYLYGGIYTLPSNGNWSASNSGPYWIYVGYASGPGSITEVVLTFACHSYNNDASAAQDSLTTLRLKGGSPAPGRTFCGNAQAYVTGQQNQPYSFYIGHDSTRSKFYVFAAVGNYCGGSMAIVQCNNFTYVGTGGTDPTNNTLYPITASIQFAPYKIYTSEYAIDMRNVGAQSIAIAPPTNGGESSMTFYSRNDESQTSTGDSWSLGHNTFGKGVGTFSIGAYGLGACLTIDSTGKVSYPNTQTPRCFGYGRTGNATQYYRLGTLNLPQGGQQAAITVNLCFGYSVGRIPLASQARVQNYQLTINVYSSNGVNSLLVDASTYTGSSYPIGIYHHGFVQCTSPYVSPLGCYLGLTSDPQNKIDIWVQSYSSHGTPLVQVSQTAGSFDTTTATTATTMLLGAGSVQLDVITYIPTFLYRIPNRISS